MKKKLLASLLTLCMVLTLLPATALAAGTALEPSVIALVSGQSYTVSTPEQLVRLADLVNAAETPVTGYTVTLLNDIDLAGYPSWKPIGTYMGSKSDKPFSGTFDGGGFEVKNLSTNPSDFALGLFAYVGAGGTVKNLCVSGAVTADEFACGVAAENYGTVENCCNCAVITANRKGAGGVVVHNASGGIVRNCYNTAAITATSTAGGVVGENHGTVSNCYNIGKVKGGIWTGGVVGNNPYGTVENCVSLGGAGIRRIYGSDTSFGRVTGQSSSGILRNNQARSDMLLIDKTVTGGTAADLNGADLAVGSGTAQSAVFAGWDPAVWNIPTADLVVGAPLPTLKTISAAQTPKLSTAEIIEIDLDGAVTALESGKNYAISHSEHLGRLSDLIKAAATPVTGYTVRLKNTIDLSNQPWTPIGTYTSMQDNRPFSGTFDGCGFEVQNLLIDDITASYQGLFGAVGTAGVVQNLGVSGTVRGVDQVGAVAGINEGTVQNCYSTAAVSGTTQVGGLVGYNWGGTVKNCYSTGAVSGTKKVGGIAGQNSGTLQNCYSTGTVSGTNQVGGMAGYCEACNISSCVALGTNVLRLSGNEINFGRVFGEKYMGTTASNNQARSDMFVIDKAVTGDVADPQNGADLEVGSGTAQSAVFTGWDPAVWEIPSSALTLGAPLPSLKGFAGAQAPVLPRKEDISSTITFADGSAPYSGAVQAYEKAATTSTGGNWSYTYSPITGALENNLPKKAGTYTVTAKYETITQCGTAAAIFTITPKELTVTASATDHPYDGDTDEPLTFGPLVGAFLGDTVSLAAQPLGTIANKDAAAARKPVTIPLLTLAGADQGNYTLTQPAGVTVLVNKKPAAVTIDNISKDYLADLPPLTFSCNDMAASEPLTVLGVTLSTTATKNSDAKTYPITAALGESTNYTVTATPGTLTVNKGTLTLSSQAVSAQIGGGSQADLGALVAGNAGTLTYGVSSTADGDAVLAATPSLDAKGVLTFAIASSAKAGQTATVSVVIDGFTNYGPATVDVVITVTEKTAVTVNMDGITLADKTYDGTALAFSGAAAGTHSGSTAYTGGFDYKWYEGSKELAGAPKTAGSYTLKAIVTGSTYAGEGSKQVTIAQKTLTIGDGDLAITKPYDGEMTFTAVNAKGSLALTDIEIGDTVTAKIDTFGAAADASVGTKTIDLAVSLEGADKGNYTVVGPYSFKKADITIKATTPTVEAIAKQTYTGNQLSPAVTVKDGIKTLAAGDYDVTYGANIAVGTASGSVTVALKGNYNGTANTTFEIGKATAAGTAKTFQFVQGTAKDYTFDLSAMLPAVSSPASLGAVSYATSDGAGAVLSGAAAIAGSIITLPVKAAATGDTQDIAITITSENYTIAPVTLTLTAMAKESLTITASMAGGTYNGTPFAYGGTPTFKKTSDGTPVTGVSFEAEYEGVSPTNYTKTTVAPTNAGTYKLILTVNGASATTYAGSVEVPFSIAKATITVTASDKTAYVGDTPPILAENDFTATGLIGNETLKTKPTLAYAAAPDMTKPGKVTIEASAAAAPDGGNYNDILYVFGTLTISDRPYYEDDTTPIFKPDPPKTDPITGNTEVSIPVKPTTKGDTSSAAVPEQAVSDAIASAEKEAAKTGGTSSVAITVDAPKGAKTVETTLSAKSLSAVANGKTQSLKISTPLAEISFDSKALAAIAGAAGKDVTITVSQVDPNELTDAQKNLVGDAPVFDFTVTSDGKIISDFGGGTATVTMPYTPKDGENPEFVTIWLLDDSGKLIPIQASYKDGAITFETTHFSRYAIGYLPFTDVKADWAYGSIVYAYQNKLFSGMGANRFAPADDMTRAMLWSVLYRMAGSPDKTENPATWYADAQKWAMAQQISNGADPDDSITREQLATILYRYAKAKTVKTDMSKFTDTAKISDYARDSMSWAVANGILQGDGGKLNPQDNATRAEVAAMLQRFAGRSK